MISTALQQDQLHTQCDSTIGPRICIGNWPDAVRLFVKRCAAQLRISALWPAISITLFASVRQDQNNGPGFDPMQIDDHGVSRYGETNLED